MLDSNVRRKTNAKHKSVHVMSSNPITRFPPNRRQLFRPSSTHLCFPETLPVIAGKPASSHVICNNWLFAITRNSTNFFQA
uniref:Uncharacterized protein n=1 Tax=Timema genevievae TaxID=629358 RepID=A0A7R9JTG3_TIMGE|nr:unnamed protein product [Timema genevievae]